MEFPGRNIIKISEETARAMLSEAISNFFGLPKGPMHVSGIYGPVEVEFTTDTEQVVHYKPIGNG